MEILGLTRAKKLLQFGKAMVMKFFLRKHRPEPPCLHGCPSWVQAALAWNEPTQSINDGNAKPNQARVAGAKCSSGSAFAASGSTIAVGQAFALLTAAW